MTEAEGAAIAELVGVAEDILEKVLKDGADLSSVQMDQFQKQRLLEAYTGVMSMISNHRRAAEKKLAQNKTWMQIIRNRNHQVKITDEKGIPLETPVERAVAEKAAQLTLLEQFATGKFESELGNQVLAQMDEAKKQAGDDDQADHDQPDIFDDPAEPSDDDQADDDQAETITETAENGATLSWPAITGVPHHLVAGLIQAVRDHQSKAKACAAVAKETGLDKFEVSGFFEELLKQGIFEKRGAIYVAHMPNERPPAEASIG